MILSEKLIEKLEHREEMHFSEVGIKSSVKQIFSHKTNSLYVSSVGLQLNGKIYQQRN